MRTTFSKAKNQNHSYNDNNTRNKNNNNDERIAKTRNLADGIYFEMVYTYAGWMCPQSPYNVLLLLLQYRRTKFHNQCFNSKICCFDFLASSTMIPSLDMFFSPVFTWFPSTVPSPIFPTFCFCLSHFVFKSNCKWIIFMYSIVIVIRWKFSIRYTWYT